MKVGLGLGLNSDSASLETGNDLLLGFIDSVFDFLKSLFFGVIDFFSTLFDNLFVEYNTFTSIPYVSDCVESLFFPLS